MIKLKTLAIASMFTSTALMAAPDAAESEYFTTVFAGFMMDKGQPSYQLAFDLNKPLPENARIEVELENPVKGHPVIKTAKVLTITDEDVKVSSYKLECIRNHRSYTATIKLFGGDESTTPLSAHTQKVEFSMPKKYAKAYKVALC